MSTMDKNWTAFINSDVFEGAVNEDGETPDELNFYVICENHRGDRFRSHASFATSDMDKEIAERKVQALLRQVNMALHMGADPSISPKWSRTRPCYASEAYAKYGQAEEVAWEKSVG